MELNAIPNGHEFRGKKMENINLIRTDTITWDIK